MPDVTTLGGEYAHAIAAKDADRLRALLHPEIEFRALTPRRSWEADTPEDVLTIVFGSWFEDADTIETVDRVETDTVGDRERVGYRFLVTNDEGRFVVEQQAYLTARDGRIDWLRSVCSGFRPLED